MNNKSKEVKETLYDCGILYHPQEVKEPNKKSVPALNDEPSAPLLDIPQIKSSKKGNMNDLKII